MSPLEEAHRLCLLLTEDEAARYLPWLMEALQHPDPTQTPSLLQSARIKLLESVETYSRWSTLARVALPSDEWLVAPERFVVRAEPEEEPSQEDFVSWLRVCRAARAFLEGSDE